MKKILLLISMIAFLIFGTTVYAAPKAKDQKAEANAVTKIGVIDLNKILMEAPQLAKAKEDLKKKFKKDEEKITKAQASFQSMIKDFNKKGPTMKEADKKKEEEKIIKEQQNLQQMQAKFQKNVGEAQNKAMKDILKNVEDVVKKAAESKKLDLIITKASLAYNKKDLEITDEIIKQLKGKKKLKAKKAKAKKKK